MFVIPLYEVTESSNCYW